MRIRRRAHLGVGEQDALSWQRTASFLGRFGYGEVVEQAGASQFARVIVKGTCVAGAAAYTVGDWVPLQLDEPLVYNRRRVDRHARQSITSSPPFGRCSARRRRRR